MHSTFDVNTAGAMGGMAFVFLAIVWGIFVTIFWMVCGWRAMRAHERLANSVDQISRKQG
jgi:Flp pilus assembly protein TadB